MLPTNRFPTPSDFDRVVNIDIIPEGAKAFVDYFTSRREEEEFLAISGSLAVCRSLGLIKNGVLTPISIASTMAEQKNINNLLIQAKALKGVDETQSMAALNEAIALYNDIECGERKLAVLAKMDAVSEEAAGGRFNVSSSVEAELKRRESVRIKAAIGNQPVLGFLSAYGQ